jgi:UDP-N-acetylglucosamine diphosphorylase / glucose-1-phosphate thymidylyltransferase / UDP-N-acetylgalactosamine diphosphorylase / glucosamine-1-phosphate N-acetyltransferase / galactosamine-1-phosphate N-acetyltransferase
MLKIILQNKRSIMPFNEPARDLRIQNKPLWLAQRDLLAPYTDREIELPPGERMPQTHEACIVYRDNLWFNEPYLTAFLQEAMRLKTASRAAFSMHDGAFREHCLPLANSYTPAGDLYLADLWYYPNGPEPGADPLVVDMQAREVGYYHVPTYMATENGDLVYQVPLRALIAIDSWVHIFIADMVFGLFGRGARFEDRLDRDLGFKLGILGRALYEGRQVLESSAVVQVGRNCVIDPTAVIHGPTSIGDNVTVGAGAVIENCIIGDYVNISQGCQLMLSVVGDSTFLPFRASMFMTTIMENSMVAQNTCLQMCVVGRNSFIGAGNTFTDFNLVSAPIKARDANGELKFSNRPVLGGCVGHNCRIGAGMIIYPARMIESDVVLVASKERRVIERDVFIEDSDHYRFAAADMHKRLYPRPGEATTESW